MKKPGVFFCSKITAWYSIFMIEQWFLDLDGVRSGPYQTPEIMSLIAEGEVLPHHRIATSLQGQNWKTILDWRLEQAKLSKKYLDNSEVSAMEGLDILPEAPPVEESFSEIVEPPPLNPPEEDAVAEIAGEFEFVDTHALAEVPKPETKPEIKHDGEPPPHFETPVYSEDKSRPRRDPMAEMFDILQNTKQKREAKQNQTSTPSHPIPETKRPSEARSNHLVRTLMIGGGVTLIGFALGQLFQQQSVPPHEAALSPPKPAPTLPAATTAPKSESGTTTEVIDRSTEKLTIRGVVERKTDPNSTPTPTKLNSKSAHSAAPSASQAENPQTEKELEELQNLKKELQELKNLKNNSQDDESGQSEGESMEGGVDTSAQVPAQSESAPANPEQAAPAR